MKAALTWILRVDKLESWFASREDQLDFIERMARKLRRACLHIGRAVRRRGRVPMWLRPVGTQQ
eukprot:6485673-Amphidinium_carterae.2